MQTKAHHQEQESLWITKQQAEALTGLDESTLKNHRLTTGRLIRDIHWQAIGTRKTLYFPLTARVSTRSILYLI
jgi:hypothetical protein